jgi:hypothetical protein
VFRVGPCPLGEAHVMCDHTAGSIDVGDWDLARDRVVDECTECGCGGDSRDFVNTLGISAGSPAGAEAANAVATS